MGASQSAAVVLPQEELDTTTDDIPTSYHSLVPPAGKLLIFVNPHSGSGKGVHTFKRKVAHLLESNNIEYELAITNEPNHAKRFVEERKNILDFNGIMILSGDGLVYEVLNGLCERADAIELVPRLPLALIPSGSGNGLLVSLFGSKGWSLKQPALLNQAISLATSPAPSAQPINLVYVQTAKENVAAFLCIAWGLMADIDIESEKYRKVLGSSRFTVSVLNRSINLRTYKGKLHYKSYKKRENYSSGKVFPVYEQRGIAESPGSRVNKDEGSRCLDNFWEKIETISVPKLEEEIPADWATIEGEFVGVFATFKSHITAESHFMPGAKLDDDKIYLTYVLWKDIKNRAQLIKMFLDFENGKHLQSSFFKVVEVSAFRIEPSNPRDLLVVDGEIVEADRLQAVVTDLKTSIFS